MDLIYWLGIAVLCINPVEPNTPNICTTYLAHSAQPTIEECLIPLEQFVDVAGTSGLYLDGHGCRPIKVMLEEI